MRAEDFLENLQELIDYYGNQPVVCSRIAEGSAVQEILPADVNGEDCSLTNLPSVCFLIVGE